MTMVILGDELLCWPQRAHRPSMVLVVVDSSCCCCCDDDVAAAAADDDTQEKPAGAWEEPLLAAGM